MLQQILEWSDRDAKKMDNCHLHIFVTSVIRCYPDVPKYQNLETLLTPDTTTNLRNHAKKNKGDSEMNRPAYKPANVDINDLVDINDVKIDTSLPVEERKRQFLKQIKNPYLYRDGDMIIRISHTVNTGITIKDRLIDYLLSSQGLSLR